jgi:hypothetical protein
VSMRTLIRLAVAALLGVSVAVLVSCGSSGKSLIPEANAGPLQSDFEAVAQAAQAGNGNCAETTAAINKTERDFASLPSTVDAALRNRLSKGISNLRERALALCAQPLAQTATTTTPRTTTTPAKTQTTAPAPAPTTSTPTTPTTPTPTAPAPTTSPNSGGGTAAPGNESPSGAGQGGGTGVGESGGAGAQEGGK